MPDLDGYTQNHNLIKLHRRLSHSKFFLFLYVSQLLLINKEWVLKPQSRHMKINVSTQKYDFERPLCAQTQDLQPLKSFVSQMNPKEFVHNTVYPI